MMMDTTLHVKVARRGTVTIPKQVRDRNNINAGDTLNLIELGDSVIVISPFRSRVNEIADKLAKELQNTGETMESMLSALRGVRAEKGS
jgi:AbrB family looped-hinge helix DNA binding protein